MAVGEKPGDLAGLWNWISMEQIPIIRYAEIASTPTLGMSSRNPIGLIAAAYCPVAVSDGSHFCNGHVGRSACLGMLLHRKQR
jgi:hypothetical protein